MSRLTSNKCDSNHRVEWTEIGHHALVLNTEFSSLKCRFFVVPRMFWNFSLFLHFGQRMACMAGIACLSVEAEHGSPHMSAVDELLVWHWYFCLVKNDYKTFLESFLYKVSFITYKWNLPTRKKYFQPF